MSHPDSRNEYADRKAARNKHKRTFEEQMEHFRKYGWLGPKYRTKKAPILGPIDSETPPAEMVMGTYACMSCLSLGWFLFSIVGTSICGSWRNNFTVKDFTDLNKVFDTVPVNRWAVNTTVSFIMLIFFLLETLRSFFM